HACGGGIADGQRAIEGHTRTGLRLEDGEGSERINRKGGESSAPAVRKRADGVLSRVMAGDQARVGGAQREGVVRWQHRAIAYDGLAVGQARRLAAVSGELE